MDENMLLNFALDAGELMLESGAETYRVEDTIERILAAGGKELMPEAFVTTTGAFASIQGSLTGSITRFKRISGRCNNLEKIALVNDLSRKFVENKISLEEAFAELERIHSLREFPEWLVLLSYGIGCAMFSMMFQGSIADGAGAFIVGILLGRFVRGLAKHHLSVFLINILGGILITILALALYSMGIGDSYDKIIIGSLMPLVPGVAITNAIRDIMEGNFLSGTSGIVEAVLIAISIASGVGIILKIFTQLGGTL